MLNLDAGNSRVGTTYLVISLADNRIDIRMITGNDMCERENCHFQIHVTE